MKTITNTKRGILLGLGLLGASTLAGLATPASAQPRREVKAARRDVKVARKNLQQQKRDLRVQQGRRSNNQFNNRPVVRNSFGARTLEGTVINDLQGNDFTLRTSNGQIVRVIMPSGEPGSLSRNDLVRVTGSYQGSSFSARSASILRNR